MLVQKFAEFTIYTLVFHKNKVLNDNFPVNSYQSNCESNEYAIFIYFYFYGYNKLNFNVF